LPKYGFIGTGNMASAIIKGTLLNKKELFGQIYVYNKNNEKQQNLCEQYKVISCNSENDVIENCDIVFLCIKPNMFKNVISKTIETIKIYKPLLVSIAGGLTLENIQNMLGNVTDIQLVRSMPNLNSQVGYGITAYCCNNLVSKTNNDNVNEFLNYSGMTVELEEKYFSAYTSIAGCSNAYVYMFIEALATGALKSGMKKSEALKIVAQSVLGSATMVLNSNEHPAELIDRVCSPGGITIEGVCKLKEKNFESTIIEAVNSTIAKDKIMQSDN
jgi:pyrroline-5-carboxylate reductase